MKLEGKCCNPANKTEYELMKAVAIAAGYKVIPLHVGYGKNLLYGIEDNIEDGCVFCAVARLEEITLHDWVFKAVHKDTGEPIAPEWAVDVRLSDYFNFYFTSGKSHAFPLADTTKKVVLNLKNNYWPVIITRQPEIEQTWYEKGELPPAGTRCQVAECEGWVDVFIVGKDSENRCVFEYLSIQADIDFGWMVSPKRFRPIPQKSARDKWIERASGKSPSEIYDALKSGELVAPKED